ncbi:MAG: FeoA domain-containing protein [Gemmatimonadales bacterium]
MPVLNSLLQAAPVPADPATALLVFAGIVLALAVALWPRLGLVWRIRRLARLSQRVRIEDALKHLTNTELAGRRGTVESVGGALEISRGKAVEILALLTTTGLIRAEDDAVLLTAEGRAYGMRMLRAHRLLERFFADRTGIAPGEWHDRAELGEHELSEAEAERLAVSMGDPLVDPHGDPIPTRAGTVPPRSGMALAGLAAGTAARVVHVEDEPREVYDRLRALGLHPGVPVKVLETRATGTRLLAAGEEIALEPSLVANVTVQPVAERDTATVLLERLDALKPGERALVAEIAPAVQGPERRRLLDLGILPGTELSAEMVSPSGDPVAYRIRGALIALRQTQAAGIYIRRESVPAEQVA